MEADAAKSKAEADKKAQEQEQAEADKKAREQEQAESRERGLKYLADVAERKSKAEAVKKAQEQKEEADKKAQEQKEANAKKMDLEYNIALQESKKKLEEENKRILEEKRRKEEEERKERAAKEAAIAEHKNTLLAEAKSKAEADKKAQEKAEAEKAARAYMFGCEFRNNVWKCAPPPPPPKPKPKGPDPYYKSDYTPISCGDKDKWSTVINKCENDSNCDAIGRHVNGCWYKFKGDTLKDSTILTTDLGGDDRRMVLEKKKKFGQTELNSASSYEKAVIMCDNDKRCTSIGFDIEMNNAQAYLRGVLVDQSKRKYYYKVLGNYRDGAQGHGYIYQKSLIGVVDPIKFHPKY